MGELALASTALAPVLFVIGVRLGHTKEGEWSWIGSSAMFAVGGAMLALSYFFIRAVRRSTVPEMLVVLEQKPADKDVLGFVLAYVLPAVAFTMSEIDTLALLVASVFSVMILWRTDVLHVNPVVALQGYRFLEIQESTGLGGLLLTKDRTRSDLVEVDGKRVWRFRVIRLTDTVWLHEPKE